MKIGDFASDSVLEQAPPGHVLLHVCCACCAAAALSALRGAGHTVTAFFYNPNIYPEAEYQKRLDACAVFFERAGIPFVEGSSETGAWEAVVKGLEGCPEGGARCDICFKLRLEAAARKALELGCAYFATTLTLGPQKNVKAINAAGAECSIPGGPRYLKSCFRKDGGFMKSMAAAKELNLYRQNYCGCKYSM